MAEKTLFQLYLSRNPSYASQRSRAKDLTGQRFGLLTVVDFAGRLNNKHLYWKCVCDCGAEKIVQAARFFAQRPARHCGDAKKHSPYYDDEIIKKRFLDKIEKQSNGCWLWKGTIDGLYGVFTFKRVCYRAHRASHILFKGPIPEGAVVMHSCDNPPCVNPDHLSAGTQLENMLDMKMKDRRGQLLTAPDVIEIKYALCTPHLGNSPRKIAAKYGTSQGTILGIRDGRTWTHIPWPTVTKVTR